MADGLTGEFRDYLLDAVGRHRMADILLEEIEVGRTGIAIETAVEVRAADERIDALVQVREDAAHQELLRGQISSKNLHALEVRRPRRPAFVRSISSAVLCARPRVRYRRGRGRFPVRSDLRSPPCGEVAERLKAAVC